MIELLALSLAFSFAFSAMTRANPNLNNHNSNAGSSGGEAMEALLQALTRREETQICCDEQRECEQAQLQAQLSDLLHR